MKSGRIGSLVVTGAAFSVLLTTSMTWPEAAQARQIKNNTRTNVNANVNRNRNLNVNRNRSANVNVNRHVDVDVDVDDDRHPIAAGVAFGAAAAVTSAVIGSVVRTLPPACSAVVVNGIAYQQCGGAWYQPQYAGSSVTYVVVNPPQ